MNWKRTNAFGYDEYTFYDDEDKYVGNYVPKRDKISISRDVSKEELRYIYNTVKHR